MITLKQEPIFTVCVNGQELSGFRVIDEWEGFKKLQRGQHILIIASDKAGGQGLLPFSEAFKGFFAKEPADQYHIIMASPDLLGLLSIGSKDST